MNWQPLLTARIEYFFEGIICIDLQNTYPSWLSRCAIREMLILGRIRTELAPSCFLTLVRENWWFKTHGILSLHFSIRWREERYLARIRISYSTDNSLTRQTGPLGRLATRNNQLGLGRSYEIVVRNDMIHLIAFII